MDASSGWRCFHCYEFFPDTEEGRRDARDHFGLDSEYEPGCVSKLTPRELEYRRLDIVQEMKLVSYQDMEDRLVSQQEELDYLRGVSRELGEARHRLETAEGQVLAAKEFIHQVWIYGVIHGFGTRKAFRNAEEFLKLVPGAYR